MVEPRVIAAKKFVKGAWRESEPFLSPSPKPNPETLVSNNVRGRIGRSSPKAPDNVHEKVLHRLRSLRCGGE